MIVNLENETVLSLADAAKYLPAIDGRRPHCSTIWRWMRRGCRGVFLDYVRLGNRLVTTPKALNEFAARLAEADRQRPVGPPKRPAPEGERRKPQWRSEKQRQREAQRAERRLREAGVLTD